MAALVEPSSNGSTNWMAPSYDPLTGMFYVIARRTWGEFYKTAEGKAEGWGGRDRGLYADSVLQAIDYQSGKIRWSHELGSRRSCRGDSDDCREYFTNWRRVREFAGARSSYGKNALALSGQQQTG